MNIVSNHDYEILRSVVFSNQDLAIRLRAQVIVLFEKGINVNRIRLVVEKTLEEINNLLLYVSFFGTEDYLTISYEELLKKVSDEIFRREKEKLRVKKRNIFSYLLLPITSIFHTILNIGGIITAFLAWITAFIGRLFWRKYADNGNTNVATFETGASNNYLIQINKLVIHEGKAEESEVVEKFIAHNERELEHKIESIIEKGEKITFNNPTVDYLIEKGRKTNSYGKIDKSQVRLFASLIVAYLIYSSSFKGGVWTLSFLSVTIMIIVRGCFPSTNNIISDSPKNIEKDSIGMYEAPLRSETIDSLRGRIKDNEPVAIYDYNSYFNLVEEFYENDETCDALSAIGEKQKKFIYEYDKIDHRLKDYYIKDLDQKYYVHVVAYEDIRLAAFQMHYINSKKIFHAKILRVITPNTILYAVVIGDFTGYQIKEICDLVDEWKTFCFNTGAEIGFYYNG